MTDNPSRRIAVVLTSCMLCAGLAAVANDHDRVGDRMGDAWGMIYGGAGWWQDDPPDVLQARVAEEVPRYHEAGVRAARIGISWTNVEKARGVYDWSSPDVAIPAVAGAGINIVLCVATTPEWSWEHPDAAEILRAREQFNLIGCLPHDPEYWPDYERYLAALVERYKEHVGHYEIWNEPDGMAGLRVITDAEGRVRDVQYGGDPDWYAELVLRSGKVIRAIDPNARIGIGSFERKAASNTAFVEGLYKHDIKPYYDAISIHPYGDPFDRAWLGAVRGIMLEQDEGHKPMWLTEYSYKGDGVALAFDVRRKLRLLRETPWISMAQPLVFSVHFDVNISPAGWPRRTHIQMTNETGPRSDFHADFEASTLRLLDRWEWHADGDGRIAGPEIRREFPHQGEACLQASATGQALRIWFTPYIVGTDRVFEGWLLVEPEDREARLTYTVGVESGDILQPVKRLPLGRDLPTRQWTPFSFAIDERIPEWSSLSVVTCYIEVEASEPGLVLSVDDVYVGARRETR